MAYTKTVWQTGDVITAAKLNNAEGGIESHDPFIITASATDTGIVLNKTWQEIYDAFIAGKYCPVLFSDGENITPWGVVIVPGNVMGTYQISVGVGVDANYSIGGEIYTAQSADGYPKASTP